MPEQPVPDRHAARLHERDERCSAFEQWVYRNLAGALEPDRRTVLVASCGIGRLVRVLAREGARVVGMDRSADLIRVASSGGDEHGRVRWLHGAPEDLGVDERFGLVVLPGRFIDRLAAPAQAAWLATLLGTLEPDGRLALHTLADHEPGENSPWPAAGGSVPRVELLLAAAGFALEVLYLDWLGAGRDGARGSASDQVWVARPA